uniref:DNA repair and recombination protein RAD52 n=1 Tax=Peronospora matthiolae TaxID=2874970 RepID=A0AAV1UHT4_9STRA
MKRRLSSDSPPGNADGDWQQTVTALVAQQVAAALLSPHSISSSMRFGRVAFADQEQQSVNAFLHQKLGKDSLTRRPGPGGRKLTYIESCKAIELANRAFGFNGWSCHIIECKEERKKRGERWSIAYSSLVRIELKDGTSHEDVGFGSSDGQRDLGAALEQAKKASISDARKRALRLFGEYLGNSCYDREHIKDVNSNKPMAPLAAAPNVVLPGQPQKQQPVSDGGSSTGNRQSTVHDGQAMKPPPREDQQPQVVRHHQPQAPPPVRQHGPPLPSAQQQQYHHQQQQVVQKHEPRQPVSHQVQPQPQQHQWKPPQTVHHPSTSNGYPFAKQQSTTAPAAIPRSSTLQTTATNKTNIGYGSSTSTTASSSSSNPIRPQAQRWASSNAPPPPRMTASTNPPPIFKTEQLPTVQDQPDARYSIDDLSLSQFDYDPSAEGNAAKKTRS